MESIEIFFVYMVWGYFYELFTGKEIGVDNQPTTKETNHENTLHS